MNRSTIRRLSESLDAVYGVPSRDDLPLGNKRDPLDELVYIMLTVQTQFGVDEVYDALKRRFPDWDALLRARPATVERILAPLGLSKQRAERLRVILRRLRDERGRCTLDFLASLSDEDAEAYLGALPGVGPKVARCVLMYALGRDVLPVDAHVLRVAKRVGLLDADTSWPRAHDAIHESVPAPYRYGLHVNLVRLGRDVCGARNPDCEACPLHGRTCSGTC
ncbi:MAG: endonuclease III [Chloroflexota bacterium]